jgi:acyl dehydratase
VAKVIGVSDKGTGALVRYESVATCADSGRLLARSVQSVFIRGEGGFGGPRGESPPWPVPERAADHEVNFTTRPEQALIYRLTGDRNPLHSDPAFAARGGFSTPILHGMCTYGYTGRALLNTVCEGEPARFAAMEARFTRPVLPGDELTVFIWRDGGMAYFRTMRDGTTVIDRGRLALRTNSSNP